MQKTVLITGARSPAALEIARLLQGVGAVVHVADSLQPMLAAGSKSVTQSHVVPSPRQQSAAFAAAISAIVDRHQIDVVIPTCEEVLYLAAAVSEGCKIPLLASGFQILEELHNKFKFIELAERIGIAVPRTVLLQSIAIPNKEVPNVPKIRKAVAKTERLITKEKETPLLSSAKDRPSHPPHARRVSRSGTR